MRQISVSPFPVTLDEKYRGCIDIAYTGCGRHINGFSLPLSICGFTHVDLNNIFWESNKLNLLHRLGCSPDRFFSSSPLTKTNAEPNGYPTAQYSIEALDFTSCIGEVDSERLKDSDSVPNFVEDLKKMSAYRLEHVCAQCSYPTPTNAESDSASAIDSCRVCKYTATLSESRDNCIRNHNSGVQERVEAKLALQNSNAEDFLRQKEARRKRIHARVMYLLTRNREHDLYCQSIGMSPSWRSTERKKWIALLDASSKSLDEALLDYEQGMNQIIESKSKEFPQDDKNMKVLTTNKEQVKSALITLKESLDKQLQVHFQTENPNGESVQSLQNEAVPKLGLIFEALELERDLLILAGFDKLNESRNAKKKTDTAALSYVETLAQLWLYLENTAQPQDDIHMFQNWKDKRNAFLESFTKEKDILYNEDEHYCFHVDIRKIILLTLCSCDEVFTKWSNRRRNYRSLNERRLRDARIATHSSIREYIDAIDEEERLIESHGAPEEMRREHQAAIDILRANVTRLLTASNYHFNHYQKQGKDDFAESMELLYTNEHNLWIKDYLLSECWKEKEKVMTDDLRFWCSNCDFPTINAKLEIPREKTKRCRDCRFPLVLDENSKNLDECPYCKNPLPPEELELIRLTGINCRVCGAIEAFNVAKFEFTHSASATIRNNEVCSICGYRSISPDVPCKICECYSGIFMALKETTKLLPCSFCAMTKYLSILRDEEKLFGVTVACHSADGRPFLQNDECNDCCSLDFLQAKKDLEMEFLQCSICNLTRKLEDAITRRNVEESQQVVELFQELYSEKRAACEFINCESCKNDRLRQLAEEEAISFVLHDMAEKNARIHNIDGEQSTEVCGFEGCEYPLLWWNVDDGKKPILLPCQVHPSKSTFPKFDVGVTQKGPTDARRKETTCDLCSSRSQLKEAKMNAVNSVIEAYLSGTSWHSLANIPLSSNIRLKYFALRHIAVQKAKGLIHDTFVDRLQRGRFGSYYCSPKLLKDANGNALRPLQLQDKGATIFFNGDKLYHVKNPFNIWKYTRNLDSRNIAFDYLAYLRSLDGKFPNIESEKDLTLKLLQGVLSMRRIAPWYSEYYSARIPKLTVNFRLFPAVLDRKYMELNELPKQPHTCRYRNSVNLVDKIRCREHDTTSIPQKVPCSKCVYVKRVIFTKELHNAHAYCIFLKFLITHDFWKMANHDSSLSKLSILNPKPSEAPTSERETIVILDDEYICTVKDSKKQVKKFLELFQSLSHVQNAETIAFLTTLFPDAQERTSFVEVSNEQGDDDRYLFLTSKFLADLNRRSEDEIKESKKKTNGCARKGVKIWGCLLRWKSRVSNFSWIVTSLIYFTQEIVASIASCCRGWKDPPKPSEKDEGVSLANQQAYTQSEVSSDLSDDSRSTAWISRFSSSLSEPDVPDCAFPIDIPGEESDKSLNDTIKKDEEPNKTSKEDDFRQSEIKNTSKPATENCSQIFDAETPSYDRRALVLLCRKKVARALRILLRSEFRTLRGTKNDSRRMIVNVYLWNLSVPGVSIEKKVRLLNEGRMHWRLQIIHYVNAFDTGFWIWDFLSPTAVYFLSLAVNYWKNNDPQIELMEQVYLIIAPTILFAIKLLYDRLIKGPVMDMLAD